MDDQTAELNERFAAPNSQLENDILGELKSILRIHSLSPQELFFKWEAYSMKMGPDTQMDYKTARDFKKDLQDALERESRGKAHGQSAQKRTTTATPRNTNTGDVYGVYVLWSECDRSYTDVLLDSTVWSQVHLPTRGQP